MNDLEYLKKATDAVNEATRIFKEDNARASVSIPEGWVCPDCLVEMDPIMSFCHKCRKPRYEEEDTSDWPDDKKLDDPRHIPYSNLGRK